MFRVSGIPFLVSEKGDIIFARPYGGIQGVRGFLWCVGTGLCPSRGRPQGSPLRKRYKRCGEESPSHGFAVPTPFRQGGPGDGGTDCHSQCAHWLRNDRGFYMGCGGAGRCGERTERCRWRMKRDERVAAVKILSIRRKAARKFWAPQQEHRPLRGRCKECGADKGRPRRAALTVFISTFYMRFAENQSPRGRGLPV